MRQANDTQTKITLSPRAKAQIEKSFIERTIAEAWCEVEGEIPCYEGRAEFAVDALDQAGFAIVAKPKPGPTTEDRIEFARRLGHWDFVSLQDIQKWLAACRAGYMSRDDVIRQMGGDPVEVDRKIAEERARAASFGLSFPSDAPTDQAAIATLQNATQVTPPEAPEPERDYSGLRENSADDLAARYGCRVTLAGMDDADMPLTDEPEIGDTHYVVVTERATGRHVALVEAWETEDGDPIVPKRWLEVVLGAWDAARDPQQAA